MATEKMKQFNNYTQHTVGNIASWKIRTLNFGAKCTEAIDNFKIVELGFDEDGNRTASKLAKVGNKGYLIASPERRYMNENIDEFFNGQGDFARIIYLDEGVRFDSSAFELDSSVSEVSVGDKAHFNPTTNKFIIHDGSQKDYKNAKDQFVVVADEDDTDFTLGQHMVRFEVQ